MGNLIFFLTTSLPLVLFLLTEGPFSLEDWLLSPRYSGWIDLTSLKEVGGRQGYLNLPQSPSAPYIHSLFFVTFVQENIHLHVNVLRRGLWWETWLIFMFIDIFMRIFTILHLIFTFLNFCPSKSFSLTYWSGLCHTKRRKTKRGEKTGSLLPESRDDWNSLTEKAITTLGLL